MLREQVEYNCVFLRKVVRQRRTDVTSFLMHLKTKECGLMREAFWIEGECFVSQKRGGNKKSFVLFTQSTPMFNSIFQDRSFLIYHFLLANKALSHSQKFPAVTHILFLQTTCGVTSCQFDFA